MRPAPEAAGEGAKAKWLLVSLGVLGVVYGDLGTSTIYALHTCFSGVSTVAPSAGNVLGLLSLIFWTLIVVISLKYMTFVLRADNRGEGGIFALIALLRPWRNMNRVRRRTLILLGLFGASLLYAGVMITPSISILSAVEGLEIAAPGFAQWVIPITIAILVLLFAFQSRGTERVGAVFGPVMVIWFFAIAALGLASIVREPRVIEAVYPLYAVEFFVHNGWLGFLVLYAVFLVTTGGEALYADMGHFGRKPIRRVWFFFVLPALLLNYFGQGAALLRDPAGASQPFYHLAPGWLLYPLVILATAATVIASQATITGAFSLTRQAARLGQMPRLRVVQTSAEVRGQIYVPAVNWMLLAATIVLVLLFRTSAHLAAAYGIAVNSTMLITTLLAFNVARERGGWSLAAAGLFLAVFLTVDLCFFGSNLMKLPNGGWFPVAVGLLFFTVMSTWRRGGELLTAQADRETEDIEAFAGKLKQTGVTRVPGTAVFLTGRVRKVPPALGLHVRLNKALQEQVVLLTVLTEDVPRIGLDERLEVEAHEEGLYRVILHYGYMQVPNVPSDLVACKDKGLTISKDDTAYYISHQSLVHGRKKGGMAAWRDRLFSFLVRNSMDATTSYHIPSDLAVDMGLRVRI